MMSDEKVFTRRKILQAGLAGVAGLAAGYSLLPRTASAADLPVSRSLNATQASLLAARNLQVTIPKLAFTGEGTARQLSNEQEVLRSIAPVFEGLLKQTGEEISSAQLETMRAILLSRGKISLPGGPNPRGLISLSYS